MKFTHYINANLKKKKKSAVHKHTKNNGKKNI